MHRSIVALAAVLAIAGCDSYNGFAQQAVLEDSFARADASLQERTYAAVDDMLGKAPELMTPGTPVVVGSIEDIQDVNSSTPFGNVIAELVRSRLVQKGVNVTDLRLRSSVLLQHSGGEMLLSRDRRAILAAPLTADIATGTYAVGADKVFVSLRIMSAADGRIVAASDFAASQSQDVAHLLGTRVSAIRATF